MSYINNKYLSEKTEPHIVKGSLCGQKLYLLQSLPWNSESTLLALLTQGYRICQEEICKYQEEIGLHKDDQLLSTFQHDVETLQKALKCTLGVDWNPECDYIYPKK